MAKKKREHLLNREIRATEVRLPEEGIISTTEAIKLAEAQDMDLVLINSSASPPVCRIMDYEKFIYAQNKKVKPKTLDMKEIKLGPNMSQNDMEYRSKHGIEFLEKGHRLKISLQLRGREMAFQDKAMEVTLKFILSLEDFGIAEQIPKLDGKKIIVFVKPKPQK